jgi:hypothetical protein
MKKIHHIPVKLSKIAYVAVAGTRPISAVHLQKRV